MNGQDTSETAPVSTVADLSLPRVNRLKPAGYRDTFDSGVSVVCRLFVMYYVKAAPNSFGQVGTVVSKKTFPHAVSRNRARRLLRTAYRFTRADIRPGTRIILIGRHRLMDVKSQTVVAELVKACRKVGILAGTPE